MTQKHFGLAAAMTASFVAMAAGQTTFTPGNLVVLRVGDGTASLSNAANPVFLEEISPLGVSVQTIAMPTESTTAGNRAATISGTATSEGFINLSVDGRYLTYMGYNADVGTPSIAGTNSGTVNRVVARIAADGTVDTSTAFSDGSYSGSNPRSAISLDGTQFWMAGNGSSPASNGGVRYAALGSTESLLISDTPTNTRIVGIFDEQLYVSAMSGAFRGVSAVGTGLPTEPQQTTTLLPGFDPATNSPQSTYAFFFADPNTLYIADDRTLANGGGLQKWTFDGSNWSLAYTLNDGLIGGLRGLTGIVDRSVATLYATTTENPSRLMMIEDTGSLSEFVLIAIAGPNTAFRSVAWAPVDACPDCYANCDGSTNEPVLTVDDFTCFINEFATAQGLPHEAQVVHYANCDGSTTAPALTVDDFTCFINEFAQGCLPCP